MKQIYLSFLCLALLSGCSQQPIEPDYNAMDSLTLNTYIHTTSDSEDAPPSSVDVTDIPLVRRALITSYQDYTRTDAFQYFVDCVDYGMTLRQEFDKEEPKADLKRLADLTIESGEKFKDEDVQLEVELHGERYFELFDLYHLQEQCVERFIQAAEYTKEYLNDKEDDNLRSIVLTAFGAARENFEKVCSAVHNLDYNP